MPVAPCSGPVVRLRLKVVPGAARSGICGWLGDALKVRVSAPPERGKANAEVIDLLARRLGVARSALRIAAGSNRTHKTLQVSGLAEAEIMRRLGRGNDG